MKRALASVKGRKDVAAAAVASIALVLAAGMALAPEPVLSRGLQTAFSIGFALIGVVAIQLLLRSVLMLRGDADETTAGAKILERLAQPAEGKSVEPISGPLAESTVDAARLQALTQTTNEPPKSDRSEPSPDPKKPADLAKANEKLSTLLGKPK